MTVEEQIKDELDKFKNTTYNGKVEIPSNICELFKIGVLSLSPQTHGLLASKLKALYTRKYKEITNGELSDMIKIIVNTPFYKLYEGIDFVKALDKHAKFERFILCYNSEVNDFQEKLKMKKVSLISLSRGSVNGMRIIPTA